MAKSAPKTDPKLWEKVKDEVTSGDKGGKPDQWSARKAQLATQKYKKRGGSYKGRKSEDNSLKQWTDEDWGTKSGKKSGDSGERYLPRSAREDLSKEDYERTTQKKRADTKKGKQFSGQPKDVAAKTAPHRKSGSGQQRGGGATKAQLMDEAKRRDIAGRSKMSKAELERALNG